MLGKFGFVVACVVLSASLLACDNESAEQKVEDFLDSAAEKLAAGETNAAVIELKNAVQLAPEHAEARRRLGEIYLSRGQGDAAAKELRRALEHGAESPSLTAKLARALLLAGKPEEVLDLVPAPDRDAELETATARTRHGLRAQALLATGEVAAAETLARRVLENGESFEARLALGRILAGRGEPEAAIAQIDAALAERPTEPQALLIKANSLAAKDARGEAIEVLQEARTQPWRPVMVDFALIEIALQQNDTELAWRVLDELGGRLNNDPRLKYFTALRALSEERYAEARRLAEGLVGQYPDFVQAAYIAGSANVELGNFEIARSYLQTFLRRNPESGSAGRMLARAWEGLGESDKAREVLASLRRDGARVRARQLAAAETDGNLGLGAEGDAPDLETPEGRGAEVQALLEHLRNREFDAAMAKARALEAAVPDSALPVQLQGVILWAQGEQDAAIARMQAAAEKAPKDASVALNLARMHRARGETDASLQVLGPALEAHPENAALLVEAARARAARNEAAQVQDLLERALKADPEAADARAYLARFHLLQGRPEAAVEVARAAPEDQEANPALLEVTGRAHQRLGNLEEALAAFENLSQAMPERPEGYLRVGETLLAMNRPGDAVGYLEKARARSDSPKEAEVYLARALLQTGQGERAGELIGELEEKYPKESDVAILRGNHALAIEQDRQAAVAAFEKALELEPTERRLMDLVRLQMRVGQPRQAIARLQDWRANHEPSLRVDSTLAELHLATGDLDAARELYASLVERAPDNAAFQNNLAWVLGEQGKLDAALRHARKAVELAPEDPGIQDTLGMVLLKRGETEKARAHLAKAAEAAPERTDIQVNYADVLVAAGARDEAQAVLAQLASKNLSDSLRQRVDRLLERVK